MGDFLKLRCSCTATTKTLTKNRTGKLVHSMWVLQHALNPDPRPVEVWGEGIPNNLPSISLSNELGNYKIELQLALGLYSSSSHNLSSFQQQIKKSLPKSQN
jgi:hypothetical protein